VTYDSGQMTNAARIWFILQYFGIKAGILNGGWPALSATAGLPEGAGPSTGVFRAVPGSGSVGLIDRESLKRQLDAAAHVLDTRTRAEFTGEDARNRSRSGHLPGARHLRRWAPPRRCALAMTMFRYITQLRGLGAGPELPDRTRLASKKMRRTRTRLPGLAAMSSLQTGSIAQISRRCRNAAL
jgi:hypothetical protein